MTALPSRRTRLSLHFRGLWIASIIVPLIAFGIAAWIAWQDVMTETRLRLLRTVDILQEQATRSIEVQQSLLNAIQARIENMDWSEIERSEEVWRFLRNVAIGSPSSGLALVAPDGRIVVSSRSPRFPMTPVDVQGRDFVQAIRQGARGIYVGDVVEAQTAGFTHFPVATARIGPGGQPDGGIIVSGFDPAFFTNSYARFMEHPDDAVLLMRLNGSLLACQPTLVTRRLPDGAPLMDAIRDEGSEGVADLTSPGGVRRMMAFRRLPGTDLAVAYGVNRGSIRSDWFSRLAPIGLVFALAAEALLLLTALTVRAVRREAAALGIAAQEAAAARAEAESRALAEAQLRRTEKLGALGTIAAGVAHDFNNLVSNVAVAARLIRDHAEDPAQVRRLACLMQETTERGARITRRMLDFARRTPDSLGSFDVRAAMESVCHLLADTLPGTIALEWSLPDGLPALRGDRAEFETVIVNLVTNARDAMPDGGAIFITAAPDGDLRPRLRIVVADTGEGMPAEVLARAGEPFFTTKAAGQGTGLGLAMARRFAEQDDGKLSIESVPGQGTTVTLHLPVAEVTPPGA